MANPRQDKWKPIQRPTSVPVHWSFTTADYNKIVAGIEAQSMDERWEISFDGDTVNFYRSWSGYQVYEFTPMLDGGQYIIRSFNVEQDDTRYRRSDDKKEIEQLSLLLEYIVGVKPR